ncbi:MAG: hypothetical protein R3B82_07405 [Sandaracinaceae bacterium]
MATESVARGSGSVQTDVDRIVEAIVYLYTESRRVTKGFARQHGLTGPQVTTLKLLGVGTEPLRSSARMSAAKSSTVTGLIDRMGAAGCSAGAAVRTDG